MRPESYLTPGGIAVTRSVSNISYARGLSALLRKLDTQRGVYFSSGYEYPEKYSRWDFAAIAPPVEVIAAGRQVDFRPLNPRGEMLIRILEPLLAPHPHWANFVIENGAMRGTLKPLPELFPEEQRSKQPSAFSILRTLISEFHHPLASRLALVGAFGYDLLFQFDPIELTLPREGVKDLHLLLCDEIYFMDRKKERLERFQYDFARGEQSTKGMARTGERIKSRRKSEAKVAESAIVSDHTPEEYMAGVETVREGMRRGDYYEVVLRQTFSAPYSGTPSELFERVQIANPSPYEFLLQFGDEQLIGASPEIFVRVEGRRIETSPIAGTARRTGDPLRDADSIRELLNSTKEESELTMCSDVDRNDKSRVCEPGSVRVIGRRLIESYAGLFHTVDRVEGTLAEGYDSLDAFLSHMWSVTVIGAPKKWAAQAIENLEKSARGWYAGAVGMLSFDGGINTGITIRTVNLRDGVANYPAGATLLYDSIPANEDRECWLKATGFFRALDTQPSGPVRYTPAHDSARGVRMLLVDCEDCSEVMTYRSGFPLDLLVKLDPSLILISPGPGRPEDFHLPELVRHAAKLEAPVFGVCLGLQAMVEAFGGELGVLGYPMHGKPSMVRNRGIGVFAGLPEEFRVGRYHSLYAIPEKLPSCLEVTAESEDGVIMGIRHRTLPMEAVQFHPESILTLEGDCGLRLMENVVNTLARVRVVGSR
jgi:anthranilate synthase